MELLAVIVILGIVIAIAVPSIGKIIENSKIKADNGTIELVKDAATRWSINEQAEGKDGTTGGTFAAPTVVSIDKLTTGGFLAKEPSAFQTNSAITISNFSVKFDTTSGVIIVELRSSNAATGNVISYDSSTKKVISG